MHEQLAEKNVNHPIQQSDLNATMNIQWTPLESAPTVTWFQVITSTTSQYEPRNEEMGSTLEPMNATMVTYRKETGEAVSEKSN